MMYSTNEKNNGARILPKIIFLSAQKSRYLPYLELCAARIFIFPHLQPPLIFEYEISTKVTFLSRLSRDVGESCMRLPSGMVTIVTNKNLTTFEVQTKVN